MAATAFLMGLLGGSSLLLGAALGLGLRWPPRLVNGITAFGSGALIATLAFDLVEEALRRAGIGPVATGFLLGAALFVLADEALNARGGFLRKPATLARFLHRLRHDRALAALERLSTVALVRALPAEDAHALVLLLERRTYQPGQVIVTAGEAGDALYVVDSGHIELLASPGSAAAFDGSTTPATPALGAGEAFGERTLLLGDPYQQTARAQSSAQLLVLRRASLGLLEHRSPTMAEAVDRLRTSYRAAGAEDAPGSGMHPIHWHSAARHHLGRRRTGTLALTSTEQQADVEDRAGGGSGMAVFLGALLDGIPESVVIGTSLLKAAFSPIFLVAVFLANFPEALTSAVQMRQHGYSVQRILLLWGGLVVSSGLAALAGNILLRDAPGWSISGAEALAAEAILAMLTDTMMPEAYEHGGPSVALWTALGFLALLVAGSLAEAGA